MGQKSLTSLLHSRHLLPCIQYSSFISILTKSENVHRLTQREENHWLYKVQRIAISFTETQQGQLLHHVPVYKHEKISQQSFDVVYKRKNMNFLDRFEKNWDTVAVTGEECLHLGFL